MGFIAVLPKIRVIRVIRGQKAADQVLFIEPAEVVISLHHAKLDRQTAYRRISRH